MTPEEYCEYICNPIAEPKTRVVIVSQSENWTSLRRFYQERGSYELRLSDLVKEEAWLPMPDEVFARVREAVTAKPSSANGVLILGLSGYLALLTDENKREAIAALREFMDSTSKHEVVFLLRFDSGTKFHLKDQFTNPRYRQGKQLIEINFENTIPNHEEEALTEVTLVGEDFVAYIPEGCETFSKYLRYTEEHPFDSGTRRIVVASKGRELAGLSAEVLQIVCLREFARIFHEVDDVGLSEKTILWMCKLGKECVGKKLIETLKMRFFQDGSVEKSVLRVFDGCKDLEREALLWSVKHFAARESYLSYIVGREGVTVGNFRSTYVTGAAECLERAAVYSSERKIAIEEADAKKSEVSIRQFIEHCKCESTSRVAPWLNCGTDAEGAELLCRCTMDGIVSNDVKSVYPEAAAYLSMETVFGEADLEDYFREYRQLKMTNRLTQEFCEQAKKVLIPPSVQSRDVILQQYSSDNECALLVVDAMGAEWLPMIVTKARELNFCVELVQVVKAQLPTMTEFNQLFWAATERRLPDIKRFDNIAHHGEEAHEPRRPEENLFALLDLIGSKVLPRVAEGLARFERVLVTADHGSSRLAALAWQSEPKFARTLECIDGGVIADWRYRERAQEGECPPEMEETLDGNYWVVRGYNRLPKKGGGQGFEFHGGATLEERLVPIVVFSRTGQFIPKAKSDSKRSQIIENDDFDL